MELENRDAVEASFRRRLERLNARHRRELATLLGDPPDIRNVPESFWQGIEEEMKAELVIVLLLIFMGIAVQNGATGARAEASRWSASRASRVAQSYVANTREALQRAGRDWASTQAKGETVSRTQRDRDLQVILGPERADRTAATETTAAQSAGGEAARNETGTLSDQDTWFTRKDDRVCPVCEPLHRAKRSEWSAKFPEGPPAHPRCRCWIRYEGEPEVDRT